MATDIGEGARRGQRIAFIIGAILVVLGLLDLATSFINSSGTNRMPALLWFGIRLAMAWFIVKGYGWARSYLAFVLVANAAVVVVGLPLAVGGLGLVVAVPIAAALGACGWAVWRSRSLDEYCDYRYQLRNPSMSMFR